MSTDINMSVDCDAPQVEGGNAQTEHVDDQPDVKPFELMTKEERREFFKLKEMEKIETEVNKLEIEKYVTQMNEKNNVIFYVNPAKFKLKFGQVTNRIAYGYYDQYIKNISDTWKDASENNKKIYYKADQRIKMSIAFFLYMSEILHDEKINEMFINHGKEEAERAKKPAMSTEELTDAKFSRNKNFLESIEYLRDLNAQDYISTFIMYRMPVKGKFNTLEFLEKQEWNLETKRFFNARFFAHAPMFPHFQIVSEYFSQFLSKEYKESFCMVYFSSTSKAYNNKIFGIREQERKAKEDDKDDKGNEPPRGKSEKRPNDDNAEASDPKASRSAPRSITYKPDYTVTKTKKK